MILTYLKEKFPDVNPEVFLRTQYGKKLEEPDKRLLRAAQIDQICKDCSIKDCQSKECKLDWTGTRPVPEILKDLLGNQYLSVTWSSQKPCDPLQGVFGELYRKSGLSRKYLTMMFENFRPNQTAFMRAYEAFENNSSIVFVGKSGTGKTHLAVAIAIENMYRHKQAIFRFSCDLLSELRQASREGMYDDVIKTYQQVPCFVLDDWGKEALTATTASYLYQLIDYRYRNDLQTIVTTSALTEEDLFAWSKPELVRPILSRIRKMTSVLMEG